MNQSPPTDLFEPTPRTQVIDMLEGRRPEEVHAFLMERYYEPLAIYIAAVDRGRLGESRELIGGFFADRLSRPDWMVKWRESGLRLRRWLVNGLHFYCREEARRQRRNFAAILDEHALPTRVERAFDTAYARVTVQHALELAAAACEREGLGRHWQCFYDHRVREQSLRLIAEAQDRTLGQVTNMVRTATHRFRTALAELLLQDGASSDELDREIAALLESFGKA